MLEQRAWILRIFGAVILSLSMACERQIAPIKGSTEVSNPEIGTTPTSMPGDDGRDGEPGWIAGPPFRVAEGLFVRMVGEGEGGNGRC